MITILIKLYVKFSLMANLTLNKVFDNYNVGGEVRQNFQDFDGGHRVI